MYLLDTNICIYGMKGKYEALTKKLLTMNPDEMAISSVTLGELECGAAKSQWADRTHMYMLTFVSAFTVLPFNDRDALAFGLLRAQLARAGTPIGAYDIMIAAQALTRNMTLITHNISEFQRVPGLILEDWVQ